MEECYSIQGAIFEFFREMGSGFLEPIYQECMEKEFCCPGIPPVAQQELNLMNKTEKLQQTHKPDMICYGQIIVALNAGQGIFQIHKA